MYALTIEIVPWQTNLMFMYLVIIPDDFCGAWSVSFETLELEFVLF